MPALGMAQETGKLVRWLRNEGEQVTKGEPLMEIETDKAMVEIESPATGTLARVSAGAGDDVTVGRPIALVLAPGETLADADRAAVPTAGVQPAKAAPAATPEAVSPVNQAGRPPASPKARRLAAEKGVDLARVAGTGPGGAVLEEDILQAAAPGAGTASESVLWRAMSENVSRSWKAAPHFFVIREVDATALGEARSRLPKGVTYTDLLLMAVATALVRHPRMNGLSAEINIGLAVALPDGLIVPVLHGVDRLGIGEIAVRRAELLGRVHSGKVRAADVSGGTFTISNLGMYGVDLFTAILTEGQAGILAVGRIAERVVAREGAPQVRPTMMLSLSCDHRMVDGARAAEFVQTLTEVLESSPTS